MPDLLSAINAARHDGFTVVVHFSCVVKAGKCEVSVLTPCTACNDYHCRHLCSLLLCSVDEAASLIAGLTQFPC
jgi:hypothetical protein